MKIEVHSGLGPLLFWKKPSDELMVELLSLALIFDIPKQKAFNDLPFEIDWTTGSSVASSKRVYSFCCWTPVEALESLELEEGRTKLIQECVEKARATKEDCTPSGNEANEFLIKVLLEKMLRQ